MRPISQAKDFSVCLHGYTLPKYSLYGNIYGTTWYCTNFTPEKINGRDIFRIYVFCPSKKDPGRGSWQVTYTDDCKSGGAIYCYIRDFIKSAEFISAKPEKCAHKTARRQELKQAIERAERDVQRIKMREAREWQRDNMVYAPRAKRPQGATGTYLPTYSQSAVDGRGYSLDWEEHYIPASKLYVGDDPTINPTLHRSDKPFFENGQNTAGELAFMVKRDGMKTSFKNYRPEDNRPKVTGYVPKDGTLQAARIDRILAGDIEELKYHVANVQKINSKVLKMVEDKWGTLEEFRRIYSC